MTKKQKKVQRAVCLFLAGLMILSLLAVAFLH